MITAMIKLPDGKVLNKILSKDLDDLQTAIEENIIEDWTNGVVSLTFSDIRIITHWSNVVLTFKDSQ